MGFLGLLQRCQCCGKRIWLWDRECFEWSEWEEMIFYHKRCAIRNFSDCEIFKKRLFRKRKSELENELDEKEKELFYAKKQVVFQNKEVGK